MDKNFLEKEGGDRVCLLCFWLWCMSPPCLQSVSKFCHSEHIAKWVKVVHCQNRGWGFICHGQCKCASTNALEETPKRTEKEGGVVFKLIKVVYCFSVNFPVLQKKIKGSFHINRPKSMRHRSQAFASNFQDTSVKRAMPNNDGWRHMNTQVQAMTSISSWNNWVIASHCNPEHMYYNLMKIMNLVGG